MMGGAGGAGAGANPFAAMMGGAGAGAGANPWAGAGGAGGMPGMPGMDPNAMMQNPDQMLQMLRVRSYPFCCAPGIAASTFSFNALFAFRPACFQVVFRICPVSRILSTVFTDDAVPFLFFVDRFSFFCMMWQNPMIRQMMDQMTQNPQLMQQSLNSNPMLRGMMEQNPQMRQMFENPEMMRQMMNPDMLETMLQMRQMGMGGGAGMGGAGAGVGAAPGGANPWAAMMGGARTTENGPA
jgi:hypothetical protein